MVVLWGVVLDVFLEVEVIKCVEFLLCYDELMGFFNWYYIKEFFIGQLVKEDIYNFFFVMICFDLDKFKFVNDIFGYLMGDVLFGEVVLWFK